MNWNVVWSRGTGRGSTFLIVDDTAPDPVHGVRGAFLVYESSGGAGYLMRQCADFDQAVEWCRRAVAQIRASDENAPAFGQYTGR